jgi:hypothetical protein
VVTTSIVAATGSARGGAGGGSDFTDIGTGAGTGLEDFGMLVAGELIWTGAALEFGAPLRYDQVTGNRNVAP